MLQSALHSVHRLRPCLRSATCVQGNGCVNGIITASFANNAASGLPEGPAPCNQAEQRIEVPELNFSPPACAAKLDASDRALVGAYIAKWATPTTQQLEASMAEFQEIPLGRRIAQGISLVGLRGSKVGELYGRPLVRFTPVNGGLLPVSEFSPGGLVLMISSAKAHNSPRKAKGGDGGGDVGRDAEPPRLQGTATVVESTRDSLTVAIGRGHPSVEVWKRKRETDIWRCDLVGTALTYERIALALRSLYIGPARVDNDAAEAAPDRTRAGARAVAAAGEAADAGESAVVQEAGALKRPRRRLWQQEVQCGASEQQSCQEIQAAGDVSSELSSSLDPPDASAPAASPASDVRSPPADSSSSLAAAEDGASAAVTVATAAAERVHRYPDNNDELPPGTHIRDVLLASSAKEAARLASQPSPLVPPLALDWAASRAHLHASVPKQAGAAGRRGRRSRGGSPHSIPAPHLSPSLDPDTCDPAWEDVQLGLNLSQEAGVAMMMRHRVSLLQGPPGTGKTATIAQHLWFLIRICGLQGPVLVCAPSNVAVDNLFDRISATGLKTVRAGSPVKVREELRSGTIKARRWEHELKAEISSKQRRMAKLKAKLSNLPDEEKAEGRKAVRRLRQEISGQAAKIQMDVLGDMEVVCTTCVGAGSPELEGMEFPMVIMDEASQCPEPEALIPICKGSQHVVLVGDQCQLPPVVQGSLETVSTSPWGVSLFERLERAGVPSEMLQVQYRMHPSLSSFPNAQFYGGRLVDGVGLEARPPPPLPFPSAGHQVMFLDVERGKEASNPGSFSLYNAPEAAATTSLVRHLLLHGMTPDSIGLVTPYDAQVRCLVDELHVLNERVPGAADVEVKSVDGYQGREKDIIIFSCVRANENGEIGFVKDWRRMNVALTRARRGLVVVGHARTLSTHGLWRSYIQSLEKKGCVTPWQQLQAQLSQAPPTEAMKQLLGIYGMGA